MHARTKASQISKSVKEAVHRRDKGRCLMCGAVVPVECSCCHFTSRARLGLGIEENILTLCGKCHQLYDNGPNRKENEERFRNYLKVKYPDWNEKRLVYSKWDWVEKG